ncbi:MAG: ATP-binding cassette domain-containing protein, partial [Ktedonobacteraceae bacterium]|nr:ATP-binding cassette domain-containing protein [Ktedonobacteraceae bacterium]
MSENPDPQLPEPTLRPVRLQAASAKHVDLARPRQQFKKPMITSYEHSHDFSAEFMAYTWPVMKELELETAITNQHLAIKPAPTPGRDKEDITAYTTRKLPAVRPVLLEEPDDQGRPVYSSTADARRLEKQRLAEEKRLTWHDVQQLSQFITPFTHLIVLSFCLTVGIGLTALPMPYIFNILIDRIFPRRDAQQFVLLLVVLLGVFVLEELLRFLSRNVLGSLSRVANLTIIYRFYKHMLRLPLTFYQGLASTGQVLSRLNEVTSAQQTVLQMLIDAAVNSILSIIYAGVLLLTDWRLSLAVLAITPFYLGVSIYFNRRSRHLSRQVLESYAVMNGMMYEGLAGLKTIKALAAEHRFGRNVKKLILQTNRRSFQRTIFQAEANLVIGIVQGLCVIAILSFGGYLVLNRVMSAGQLMAFILILRELSTPMTTLNGLNQQFQSAAVAIDRLFEILNYPEEMHANRGVELAQVQGHIVLEQVHFSYTAGSEVLHDISLNVLPGTTIALVGRSGAGKTTIANLLMRFYLPDCGRITIDGHDLRELKIESLRRQFGVIL